MSSSNADPSYPFSRPSSEFTFVRPNRLCERLVFADGIGSSGKGMLSHILGSMEGIEKQSNHTPFDYIAYLHYLKKLTLDAAVTYLQTEADQQLYHVMMSRDVNFRPKDSTGVLQNAHPLKYVRRLFSAEGDAVLKRIETEKPVLNEAPHDAMKSAPLFFQAFGEGLRIVYVVREPFELILDWARRGFGNRIGRDPREFQFSVKRSDRVIPMFMLDYPWDEQYEEMTDIERIVLMITYCFRHNLAGYNALSPGRKRQVIVLHFDDFLTAPRETVDAIAAFLSTSTTSWTERVLKRERLPRPIKDRNEMRMRVLAECRAEIAPVIGALEEFYRDFTALAEMRRSQIVSAAV